MNNQWIEIGLAIGIMLFCGVTTFLLRNQIQKLVQFLLSLSPKQQKTLVIVAILLLIAEILILHTIQP